ncbi:MAG: excinuclease ABC subunit A [Legionellales bacterium]|nr:excinuclease ABC subunit A [Legionellales bacterium]
MNTIEVSGARTHNLKNIDVSIPKNQLVVITGPSGSGKSSLAFETLYAEGQRRYVESLSAYARQFLSLMEKPDVDAITGLSPAIAIEQKSASHNPRSTVGTVTEIYDYLRLLFARVGTPHCPQHGQALHAQTRAHITEAVLAQPEGTRLMICAPMVRGRKGEHAELFKTLRQQGYLRVLVDGELLELDTPITLDPKQQHEIDVVIDRFKNRSQIRTRIAESIESALNCSEGLVRLMSIDQPQDEGLLFSIHHACSECGYSVEKLEPRHFSFNSPKGACESCHGLGLCRVMDPDQVIHEPSLSIAQGAIRGLDHQNKSFFEMMEALAAHYHFDLNTPWNDLPESIQTIILQGSGRTRITFTYEHRRFKSRSRQKPFEGICPSMMRRYETTDSELVRDQLARYLSYHTCTTCAGTRLSESARHVRVGKHTIGEWVDLPIQSLPAQLNQLHFNDHTKHIAAPIVKEIQTRIQFLLNVGLNYLTLNRTAETLSGGESQRIRLASQLGSGLTGVMYVLDEPSIGLHPRDNQRLIDTLTHLKSLGNTVIVVEHDEATMLQADQIIDIGPQAGEGGGYVTAQGTPCQIQANAKSLTGQYLNQTRYIPVPTTRTPPDPARMIRIQGADIHNLKSVDVNIPVGCFTCVTGVSGSGKSSLINDTLCPHALIHLHRQTAHKPGPVQQLTGLNHFDRIVMIDQSPIGRTPRSNPATYVGLFNYIRECFASTQEARARGYKPGRFSFNVSGGRCEVCQGGGQIKVEMHFLADMYVTCEHCQGTRYHPETLAVKYHGKSIADVLNLTITQCHEFFNAIPAIKQKCQTLIDVGLGYLTLGQSATTLSGGEAQRIKLSRELSKRSTGHTLYVLDEPTTGLHVHDVKQLLSVLDALKSRGNTLIVIEHHLDVIKCADWIIDLGPEGGDAGGTILAQTTPEALIQMPHSATAQALKTVLPSTGSSTQ